VAANKLISVNYDVINHKLLTAASRHIELIEALPMVSPDESYKARIERLNWSELN